jgi:hypothetical protein
LGKLAKCDRIYIASLYYATPAREGICYPIWNVAGMGGTPGSCDRDVIPSTIPIKSPEDVELLKVLAISSYI